MERTQVLANERILQGGVDGNGGEKGTRWKDPKSWQMKNPLMGVDGEVVEKVQD